MDASAVCLGKGEGRGGPIQESVAGEEEDEETHEEKQDRTRAASSHMSIVGSNAIGE
jgi:hypothetical protein